MAPGALEPNLTESSVFTVSNQTVGFYLRDLPADISAVLDFANKELLSDRVPKSAMNRKQCRGKDEATGRYLYDTVTQHSCILGASPAKAHMRKHFPSISLVHKCPSAKKFVSAMIYLATKGGEIIREIAPEIYQNQKDIVEKFVKPKYRLTELYSSSISNFNIAAPYHQDMGNLPSVNIIYTKRENSTGGNLTVPDYDMTLDCCDGSMIVYPAYSNLHGVTPIVPTKKGGYRNSLVFYALDGLNY